MSTSKKKTRVVSGMRPTGKLHLGHYHGVLRNWLKLQEDYDCYFFVADWHALTTEYADPRIIHEASRDILLDWLSVGIDPEKCTIFIQSEVKEHAELHLLLSMIAPLGWLERVPSYKEMQQELSTKDLSTYGFLGYPLLQTADIALYDGAKVPVGTDQIPHIEFSREIVRRFNYLYKGNILVEPQPMLTETPKLLGPDRRKMSKSYGNSLYLSDPPEEIEKKVRLAITDPERIRREDPGHPEVCLIFDYHKLHSPSNIVEQVDKDCRSAKLGCVEDKKTMAKILNDFLDPFRRKRKELLKNPEHIDTLLEKGCHKARERARETMDRVRKVMKFS